MNNCDVSKNILHSYIFPAIYVGLFPHFGERQAFFPIFCGIRRYIGSSKYQPILFITGGKYKNIGVFCLPILGKITEPQVPDIHELKHQNTIEVLAVLFNFLQTKKKIKTPQVLKREQILRIFILRHVQKVFKSCLKKIGSILLRLYKQEENMLLLQNQIVTIFWILRIGPSYKLGINTALHEEISSLHLFYCLTY